MGLKEVKDDILTEADEEADRIQSEAESKAEEIIEEAKEEAETILEEAEEEIEGKKSSLERKQLSNARLKAKEKKLEARQDAIDEVFGDFRDELDGLTDEERKSFVSECLEKVGFEVGTVKASESFQEIVEDEGFSAEEFEKQGLLLISENGDRKQEFSFDRILEDMRDRHRKQVSEVLF